MQRILIMAFVVVSAGVIPATATSNTNAASAACYSPQVHTQPDGSQIAYYANGATSVLPPPGFNPMKASDADIVKYGLPPRPPASETGARAIWDQGMSVYRRPTFGKICPITDGHITGLIGR